MNHLRRPKCCDVFQQKGPVVLHSETGTLIQIDHYNVYLSTNIMTYKIYKTGKKKDNTNTTSHNIEQTHAEKQIFEQTCPTMIELQMQSLFRLNSRSPAFCCYFLVEVEHIVNIVNVQIF